MFKATIMSILLLTTYSGYSSEYADTNPVSWEELQEKAIDLDTDIKSQIKDFCPLDFDSYQGQDKKNIASHIFFTDYFWTEFTDKSGKKCVIMYDNSERKSGNAVILTAKQAIQLLNAHNQFGIDYEHKPVLSLHLLLQAQAVQQHDSLKYGGIHGILDFMDEHPPEKELKKHKLNITNNGYAVANTYTPKEVLELSYSATTLQQVTKDVKKKPPNRISNGKFPYKTAEKLILEVKNDIHNGHLTLEEVYNNF